MGRKGSLRAAWLLCLLPFMALAQGEAPVVGDPAPLRLGKVHKGDAIDLSLYRGKVVVITFWASWCGPCRKELPVLDALQKQAGEDWLQVIAINEDDDFQDYRLMLRQMHDFSLVQVRDNDHSVAAAYGIKAYPNLWIIDPHGNVASHRVGYGDDSIEGIVAEIRRVVLDEIERQKASAG